MVQLEELECGCCYELMVNPTTLTCGHSFCRYCLAKWFSIANKTECPQCRQMWMGFPQVNIHLRTIVENSFPEEVSHRAASQTQIPDYKEIVDKFEAHKKGEHHAQPIGNIDVQQIQGIVGILLLVVVIILVLALAIILYSFFVPSGPRVNEVIYFEPVQKWTTPEVVSWTQGFTGQFGHDYSAAFAKAGINGQLLLSLTEEDLASVPLSISTPLHRKILLGEISRLNLTKVKQPKNLWDYKEAHRGNVLFLLFMLQDSPRLTFAYLHYMEYYTIFLPFLRAVNGKRECGENAEVGDATCLTKDKEFTATQKFKFYLRVLLFPYYLISQFSWTYIDIHWFTMWIVISHCIMLTVEEVSQVRKLPRIREFPSKAKECVISFVITCIWYWSLLSVTPAFLCDIVFYAKLYYGPVDTANRIRKGNLRTNIIGKIINVLVAIGLKLLGVLRFFIHLRN